MKKYFISMAAATLAIAAVAFTRPAPRPAFSSFYFPLSGTTAQSYQRSDSNVPYTTAHLGCNTTDMTNCEGGFPGYNVTGSGPWTFTATGTVQSATITKKP